METIFYSQIESPVGPLLVGVSARGLMTLGFGGLEELPKRMLKQFQWTESSEKTEPYVTQLEEYFAGKRREFSFNLDLRGTEFQKRCWDALLAIPYGQTKSYADIARTVGRPAAFRAVGQANHTNPIAIVVPCHRVVASDGKLAGYGGGLSTKEKLLRLEGARL